MGKLEIKESINDGINRLKFKFDRFNWPIPKKG